MEKELWPKFKKVKMLMPHCPICKEILKGNNSMINPYSCSCGEWRFRVDSCGEGKYKIIN